MTNAPSADWYFIEVYRHLNPGNFYEVQTAHAMTGANVGTIYERVQQSASAGAGWGAWTKQGGGSNGFFVTGGYAAPSLPNPKTGGYSCPAGSTPYSIGGVYVWAQAAYGAFYMCL